MAIDHEQLARELEEKFIHRFTDKDECYVKELNARPISPPCVYPYFNHQRGRGGFNQHNRHNRPDNNRYHNQHNSGYNNSYNQRQNQYGQHYQGGQSNSGYHHDSERSSEYKKRRHD